MVPTSAVRETLILILFGIILVPIAAKRAQDARGYWQTFQLQNLATTLPTYDHAAPLVLAPSIIHNNNNNNNAMAMAQNESSLLPAVPVAVVYATSSAPRAETARTGLTIHFGSATAAVAGEATATTAPSLPQKHQQQQHSSAHQEERGELHAAAKMSDASKGRWTLIWMSSAIAAVAVFMSLC
ncbi:hypothetical protein N0V82_010109 [Gnomoniopsis sp. IMI 355080]|nr:hypothetical protein N0V82_010109 [Gnomoniopsis sp. IMI 355080]